MFNIPLAVRVPVEIAPEDVTFRTLMSVAGSGVLFCPQSGQRRAHVREARDVERTLAVIATRALVVPAIVLGDLCGRSRIRPRQLLPL
jgi:hypothetical protein